MQYKWLQNNRNSKLIIFCNGWGMDKNPFLHLDAGCFDIITLYDYRSLDLPVDLPEICVQYKQVYLVSWSFGVWVGQKVFKNMSDLFVKKVAINGTLCPVNNKYGIAKKIFALTVSSLQDGAEEFYRRMCSKSYFTSFKKIPPGRPFIEQREELICLDGLFDCVDLSESIYTKVLISDNDQIFPAKNQYRFWGESKTNGVSVKHLAGTSHFPFDMIGWDEICR